MCGIIGYSGHRPAVPLLLEGLHRLEYRGYDSSGVAFEQAGRLQVVKAAGKLSALEAKLEENAYMLATTGVGHTRWATHGLPVEKNAHPHLSQDGGIAIVHNGIIENFQELKDELSARGHTFLSDTDTEVLAHLIGEERKTAPSLKEAFARALRRAHGAYAVVMIALEEPGVMYAARMAAPLLMGVGVGECFVASDIPAFLPYTREVVFLEDGELARISGPHWQVLSLADLSVVEKCVSHVPWDMQAAAKGGYKHFMLKEIMEQPRVITDCLTGRVAEEQGGPRVLLHELDALPVPTRLHIVACGTSYNAGLWGRQLLEGVGGIPTDLDIASEFRYRDPILLPGEVVMVISQSGETADTLAALREAKRRGARVLAVVNVVGSSIAKAADDVLYTWAGPEIAVATTKAFSTQLAVMYLLALYIAQELHTLPEDRRRELLEALVRLPEQLEELLSPESIARIQYFASQYFNNRDVFFIGRNIDSATCLEGSLKLKEIAYIHSEAYPAGELKHGPISLIENGTLVVAVATNPALFDKTMSNVKEVSARGADVLGITIQGFEDAIHKTMDSAIFVPRTEVLFQPSMSVLPLQTFAYYVALMRGCDVDKPRNLAKSVTVE